LYQRALFGEMSWQLSPAWTVTLGDRWFGFTLEHTQVADAFYLGARSECQAESDEDGHSPKLGLAYRPRDDRLYFANIAAGVRPGGPNQFDATLIDFCRADLAAAGYDGAPPPFKNDSIWSYEIGTRLQFPSRRLALDASAYQIDWEDMQVVTSLNCGYGFGANAGTARSDGSNWNCSGNPAVPRI
jgi:outer membrane receptor protein involved in Fe transport